MNWRFLEDCWPLEERPESLRVKKYVAKLSSEKIRSYYKLWQEGQKANKRDSDSVVKDTKPREVKFREGVDDSFTRLHPARFCRFPLEDPENWWFKTPTVRRETYVSMPLDFLGMENAVADVTIKKLHKKTELLELKHFLTDNVSVASRAKRETRTHNSEEVSTTMEFNWQTPTNLSQAREAVHNFANLNFMLFPFDPTGLVLLRLLNKYNWFSMARDEKTKVELIRSFFNLCMKKSAHAAMNNKCIPSSKNMEDWLKDILTKNNLSTVPHTNFPNTGSTSFGGGNFNNYSGRSFKQGGQNRSGQPNQHSKVTGDNSRMNPRDANGVGLCHDFNKPDGDVCKRKPAWDDDKNAGCKDSSGTFFLHSCSQWINKFNKYCNRKHQRKDCRFFRR